MASRFLLLGLFLAFAAGAAVEAQRVCIKSASPVIFVSGGLTDWVTRVTPQQCEDRCAGNSTCVAFSWMPDIGGSSCYLFKIISRPGPVLPGFDGFVSGRCGAQLPQVKGDFAGNDLANAPAKDADACSYLCEDTTGCMAYSWTNYNRGTCWMKTTMPEKAVGPFDGSVVSGEVFKCEPRGQDVDIVGGDLSSVPRADWRECCGVCRRTKGCSYATWSDYNGGTCWLKKSASQGLVESIGAVSMGLYAS